MSKRSALLLAVAGLLFAGCTPATPVTVTVKPLEGAKTDGGGGGPTGAPPAGYGNVVGKVTLEGAYTPVGLLYGKGDRNVKDADVCAADDIPDESLVVGENNGIANVIIFLYKPKHIKPELAAVPETPEIFDQKGCRFKPHVLVVRVGQPVNIVSHDNVLHNTHTDPKRNDGVNRPIKAEDDTGITFAYRQAEQQPVPVKCDLHAWMRAYHMPFDHPYFAKTEPDGTFRIEGVPAGEQTFRVWHERGGFLERRLKITVEVDKDVTKDLSYVASELRVN